MTERFVTGLIAAPFGLSGQVKVRPLSGEGGHLLALRSVLLRTKRGERRVDVENASLSGAGVVLMKFRGVDSPEDARELGGAELVVSRAEAAPLGPGEFYVEDLKGLSVVDISGCVLGKIVDIVEGGGGQLAEIRLLSGSTGLAPFRAEFFGEINLAEGFAVLLSQDTLAL